jgi:hypothetical protein
MVSAALLAAVALSVMAASSASADEWFVEGAKLAAGKSAALAAASPVDQFPKIRTEAGSSSEIEIECTGSNLVGSEAYISSGSSGMEKSLTFEKCSVVKPTTGCALVGQPTNIPTNPLGLTTLLAGLTTKVGINLHPLSGKTFTELAFTESSTCGGGGGAKPVNGSVLFLSSDEATEAVTHTVMAQGSVENNSLEVAGNKVIIEGGLSLAKLVSGMKWSFHA